MRSDLLFTELFAQIAPRLRHPAADAALQSRPDLARHPDHHRGAESDPTDLCGPGQIRHHVHRATNRTMSTPSAP